MNIKTEILCDSIAPDNSRLTTFVATYPRFIHSELMTHRALSKNSASSRAIPLSRMLEAVGEHLALPEHWGAEQKGMQSTDEELQDLEREEAIRLWHTARDYACDHALELGRLGLHKSLCNRLLEPFAHMTVIITGERRGWNHFFALRAHPAAQKEFQVLAYRMLAQWVAHEPRSLGWGDWHIPYDPQGNPDDDEVEAWGKDRLKVATGRIARVSYLTHEGVRDMSKDIELHDRLLAGDPPHMSPFEHCAQAMGRGRMEPLHMGNFGPTWLQYRKMIPREFTRDFDPETALARKPSWISL